MPSLSKYYFYRYCNWFFYKLLHQINFFYITIKHIIYLAVLKVILAWKDQGKFMEKKIAVFWFRRDLRLFDNTALYYALSSGFSVLPVFIFDSDILSSLSNKEDLRVNFIYKSVMELKRNLEAIGSSLLIFYGRTEEVFNSLISGYTLASVYTNRDYETYAISRDEKIAKILDIAGVGFLTFKDQVIFEKSEIVKPDGLPYSIFTPYCRKWLENFNQQKAIFFPSESLTANFVQCQPFTALRLEDIGFKTVDFRFPKAIPDKEIILNYQQFRDIPALDRTSHLGIHLRFGTISIRQTAILAHQLSETWLNELIWREFFMQILFHYPYVEKSAFKSQYDRIEWINNEEDFQKWCMGKTGYPIVDAGMRELNHTGFMHNRVRMITASFLVKHLLIDWRWGEAYFAEKLLDFELSSNNGNWQWAAGTGCDAAPYFRIFNPHAQTDRFDPKADYIKHWVPEYGSNAYANPIVDHSFARNRCLMVYKNALSK
jgi:deoxyribodipyrimidine photo-lyase